VVGTSFAKENAMWKAFKITLGIVLGLLAIPTVIAIITAVKLSN
jgi:uncharacterized protein YqgC (DUF456 family)